MFGFLCMIIYLIIVVLSLLLNRDVFSPAKFYLMYLAVYLSDIFLNEYSTQTNISYLSYLFVGLILIILDSIKWNKNSQVGKETECRNQKQSVNWNKIILLLWGFSIIPIVAQIILILDMGGIQAYINSIPLRVFMWRGKGILLEMIRFYGIINLFYFTSILSIKKTTKFNWIIYGLHTILYIIIGLLSGSRSTLLFNFAFMILVYNYKVNLVRLKTGLNILILIILSASILGVFRNNVRWDEYGFRFVMDTSQNIFELSSFKYGLEPLEIVFNSTNKKLQYGLTFITPITNLVPRAIWPNKPDTGGVVITEQYLNNNWGGYSNISTGIIAEGVINFGKIFGVIFAIVLLFLVMIILVKSYHKITKKGKYNSSIEYNLHLNIYVYALAAIPSLIYTEWTNTILGLMLKIIKILIIYFTVKLMKVQKAVNVNK